MHMVVDETYKGAFDAVHIPLYIFQTGALLEVISSCWLKFRQVSKKWYSSVRAAVIVQPVFSKILTIFCCEYYQISNIRCTIFQDLNVSRLVLQLSLPDSLEPGVEVGNEDVVGAAPTGDAPTTSEWSTILLPTTVHALRCDLYIRGLTICLLYCMFY